MAEPGARNDAHAATLAAALSARVALLAKAAHETMEGIERDRGQLEDRFDSSVLADDLIGAVRSRVEAVMGDCSDLSSILDRFRTLVGPVQAEPVPKPDLALSDGLGAQFEPEPLGGGDQARREERGGVRVSDGVRLLATQMSVAGASLDEIVRQLRDDFGVPDADVVVWELFGHPDEGQNDDFDEGWDPEAESAGPPSGVR